MSKYCWFNRHKFIGQSCIRCDKKKEERRNISVYLSGWADGLSSKKQMDFTLQIAMHETIGSCDWSFSTIKKSVNGSHMVYDPWLISVIATRCYAFGYEKGKKDHQDFEEYTFIFTAERYTLIDIYEAAIKSIKHAKKRMYTKSVE